MSAPRKRRVELRAIGARIRQLRGNMPQQEFAVLLGISQAQVSKIELGKFAPSLDVLVRIAQHYGKSLDWIVWG